MPIRRGASRRPKSLMGRRGGASEAVELKSLVRSRRIGMRAGCVGGGE